MDRPTLITFSGEQGCGKDTAIEYLEYFYDFERAECKESLHTATMALFGVEEKTYWDIYLNRDTKNKPLDMFSVTEFEANRLGRLLQKPSLCVYSKYRVNSDGKVKLSVREAMIYTSEIVMKPMFGQDVFGQRRADKLESGLYIDGSFGFVDELKPAINKLGQNNILGVRILGRKDGDHDSREILPEGLLENTVDIWNGEGVHLSEFKEKVLVAVEGFLTEKGYPMFTEHKEEV